MATRKKTTRKLKFGSPAWQKKYNPAFGGKKKAKKPATKKAAKKTSKKRAVSAKPKIAKLRSKTEKLAPREKRQPRELSRYKVSSALDCSLRIANLLRLNSRERAVLADMVEKRMAYFRSK